MKPKGNPQKTSGPVTPEAPVYPQTAPFARDVVLHNAVAGIYTLKLEAPLPGKSTADVDPIAVHDALDLVEITADPLLYSNPENILLAFPICRSMTDIPLDDKPPDDIRASTVPPTVGRYVSVSKLPSPLTKSVDSPPLVTNLVEVIDPVNVVLRLVTVCN